jgi:hypothetical protein
MKRASNIKEVLQQLDQILEECLKTNSRMGLFAYIYRRTTAEIAAEIERGNFQDNERLEILDVEFANLYLDAYRDYKKSTPISTSWKFAFEAASEPLTILQHIMLGMNAHINLDLAVSTATVMKGKNIQLIEADYNKVNDMLFQIVNEMQDRLSRVSPLMFLLDWFGKNKDEQIIDFSMRKARQQAWNAANLLWSLEDENKAAIKTLDQQVLKVAQIVKHPPTRIIRFMLKILRTFEDKSLRSALEKLKM